MSDKIQITEDQAIKMMKISYHYEPYELDTIIRRFKEVGYIKKSELGIAKEKYYEYYNSFETQPISPEATQYVRELEKEIKRLRDE